MKIIILKKHMIKQKKQISDNRIKIDSNNDKTKTIFDNKINNGIIDNEIFLKFFIYYII